MESLPQTMRLAPSPSSTLSFSCPVSHVVSAETQLEVGSSEEPQILENVERGTDVPLPPELSLQLYDYRESLEEQHMGSASQSRTSLDRADDPEGVRLMEEPFRNILPNVEIKLNKREKNRLKSLRRKQRKKERWIQRQQEAKDLVRCFKVMASAKV